MRYSKQHLCPNERTELKLILLNKLKNPPYSNRPLEWPSTTPQ